MPAGPGASLRRLRLNVLPGAALLAACSLWPGTETAAPFAPLPPASYGGSAKARQILTLTAGDRSTTLQMYVDVTPQKITVVGATAFGQRVLSFSSDANGLQIVTAPPENAVRPAQVLTDLQLATWPLPALQNATAGSGWRIVDPQPGLRRVFHGAEPVAEIHYAGPARPWNGRMWLVNFPGRYTLDIESHPIE